MAEVLASSNEGSYLEQDKLLELDGLDEEQDEAGGFPFLVPAVSNLNESIATVCKRQNHKSNYRRFTIVFHLSSFVEDSENTEPCRLNGVGKTVTIFFLALCRYTADCPAEVTHTHTDILNSKLIYLVQLLMIKGGLTLRLSFQKAWFPLQIRHSNSPCCFLYRAF